MKGQESGNLNTYQCANTYIMGHGLPLKTDANAWMNQLPLAVFLHEQNPEMVEWEMRKSEWTGTLQEAKTSLSFSTEVLMVHKEGGRFCAIVRILTDST